MCSYPGYLNMGAGRMVQQCCRSPHHGEVRAGVVLEDSQGPNKERVTGLLGVVLWVGKGCLQG